MMLKCVQRDFTPVESVSMLSSAQSDQPRGPFLGIIEGVKEWY